MELYELKVVDTEKRLELRRILDDARQCDDDRNKYLHSRWYVSDRRSGEAIRVKFASEHDIVEEVTLQELRAIFERTEYCARRLRELFWKFGDFHQWLIKRMPK